MISSIRDTLVDVHGLGSAGSASGVAHHRSESSVAPCDLTAVSVLTLTYALLLAAFGGLVSICMVT